MTTTEPDVTRPATASELREQAEAIAADQPVIDIEEAPPSVAVERVAAPVAMPGPATIGPLAAIPGQEELRTLAQMATTFAHSKLVPAALQDKPEDCFLVLLTARELGIAITSAFRECHPIDGRMTVSPKMRLAMVRQLKVGRVWGDPGNNAEHHTWHAARADDPQTVYSVTYTLKDAERAGMWMSACTPDEHSDTCRKGWSWNATKDQRRQACKQNWRQYPGQMLQWRCVGYLMDQAFGEVGVGLYSADELGAVTDEDGRVIDVMESGPLDGMPDHTPAAKEPGSDPNEIAPEDVRDRFKERIYRLPHPAIETLREQWARRQQDDQPMIYPLPVLPLRQVKSADALIGGFETRAERAEWGPWTPDPLSWETGSDAPDSDPKGGTAPPEGSGAPAVPPDGEQPQGTPGPEATPDTPEPDVEAVPDAPTYDPKNPPGDVLEAAIDRANAIGDDELDAALVEAGQKPVDNHKPETKRRRLCQAWFVAQWRPPIGATEAIALDHRTAAADADG